MRKWIICLSILLFSTSAYAEKTYEAQTGFQAGELTPYLDGQIGLDEYKFGAKTMQNFFPRVQGPASNRSGFKFIESGKTTGEKVRLIPFEFSTTQAYVLEFGEDYIRFYMDGGQITSLDANNSLNLSFDGPDGMYTFTDENSPPKTMTTGGDAQADTAFKKFGEASLLLDGTGDYLTANDDAEFDISATDGGVDVWVKPVAGSSDQYTIFHQDQTADAEVYMKGYLTYYTGLLLNGNGTDESKTISDSSMNTKTVTRDGNTSLLLHGTGTSGSTVITDSSPTAHTITGSGTSGKPTINSTAKFGQSILFDDSDNQYLSITDHADFDLTGNWTIQGWVYVDSLYGGITHGVVSQWTSASQYFKVNITNTGGINFSVTNTTAQSITAHTLTANAWNHIAIVCDGSKYYLYHNGARSGSGTTITTALPALSSNFIVGANYSSAGATENYLSGRLDDLQIIKGTALYTGATYTVPTAAVAAVEIDTSNPKYGTGAIQFGGQDYLTVPDNADFDMDGDWTISFWIYPGKFPSSSLTKYYILEKETAITTAMSVQLQNDNTIRLLVVDTTAQALEHSTAMVADTWYNIEIARDTGNNLYRISVNGDMETATISKNTYDYTGLLYIGSPPVIGGFSYPFTGGIDDFKFSKGAVRHTSTFTVPAYEDRYILHPVFELGDTVPTVKSVAMHDDLITVDQFHHVEMNWDTSESDIYIFVDGVLNTNAKTMTLTPNGSLDEKLYIGSEAGGSTNEFNGWMDEFRFTKGELRHSAAFTPATQAYLLSGTTPLEVVTTYDEDELFDIQWTQSADTLYLVHPDHAPAKLTRTSHTAWTLVNMDFIKENEYVSTEIAVSGLDGAFTAANMVDDDLTTVGYTHHAATDITGDGFVWTFAIAQKLDEIRIYVDGEAMNSQWKMQYNDGAWKDVTGATLDLSTSGTGWITLEWEQSDYDSTAHTQWQLILTATASNTGGTINQIEVYAVGDPSTWGTGSYPSSIVFFENRLWLAYLQTLWASQSGDYHNLTMGTADSDALEYTIASNQVNTIEWLSSGSILSVGTAGGEYKVSASSLEEAITPSNVRIVRQSSYGSAPIMSETIKDVTLYVQRAGRKIREFAYNWERNIYVSPDLTVLAEHITDSGIVDMAYQAEPFQILWCVLNNGKLAAMTYNRESEMVAWHEHVTDGSFESVAVIPSIEGNDYDELWVSVKRTIGGVDYRYIEQLQPQFEEGDSLSDAFIVDSGLTYSGTSTTSITGLTHLEGETVAILADGAVQASKVVASGAITLDTAASKVTVGLPYTSTLQTMRQYKDPGRVKRINKVVFRLNNTKQFKYGQTPDGDLWEKTFDSLYTGDYEVDLPRGFNREGYVTVVNDKPLPITVISEVMEVNVP